MMPSEEMKGSFQLRLSATKDLPRDLHRNAPFILLIHCRCSALAEEGVGNSDNVQESCYTLYLLLLLLQLRANVAFLLPEFPMEK